MDDSHMAKRNPVDCKKISAIHLADLDDDQLGVLAQRIEVETQQLNRAMRLVVEVMLGRRRASAASA
jgi:hypothetical protein